jgi:hypothetical protein
MQVTFGGIHARNKILQPPACAHGNAQGQNRPEAYPSARKGTPCENAGSGIQYISSS